MRAVMTSPTVSWIHLVPENGEKIDASKYLGTKQSVKSSVVDVENNLTNRLVLGLNVPEITSSPFATDTKSMLLDYQLNDVEHLLSLKDGLDLNPMGLGKTVEAIELMKAIGVSNGLIIVPKATIPQWIEQLNTWWPMFKGNFIPLEGKSTEVTANNIYVTNYKKFENLDVMRKCKSFCWDIIVVDEVHNIKNPKSLCSRNLKDLPATHHLGLTGTPILNKPNDLWNLLNFCDPFYSGRSYWNFVHYYCNVDEGEFGQKITGLTKNEAHLETLNQLLAIVSVRNDPKVVAAEKTVIPVTLEMTSKQKTLYRKTKTLQLNELPQNLTIANAMALGIRLQQLTSWPGLFEGYESVAGCKFEWLEQLCKDHPDEKIVVFSKFAKTVDALQSYLASKGIAAATYTGDLSTAERVTNLKNFKQVAGVRVLLGTTYALGVGVDGLQKVSHIAVFFERDWSPEMNKQFEARLARLGQSEPVLCYYLECEHSWDKHIGKVNLTKAEDIRRALADEL